MDRLLSICVTYMDHVIELDAHRPEKEGEEECFVDWKEEENSNDNSNSNTGAEKEEGLWDGVLGPSLEDYVPSPRITRMCGVMEGLKFEVEEFRRWFDGDWSIEVRESVKEFAGTKDLANKWGELGREAKGLQDELLDVRMNLMRVENGEEVEEEKKSSSPRSSSTKGKESFSLRRSVSSFLKPEGGESEGPSSTSSSSSPPTSPKKLNESLDDQAKRVGGQLMVKEEEMRGLAKEISSKMRTFQSFRTHLRVHLSPQFFGHFRSIAVGITRALVFFSHFIFSTFLK